MLDKDFKIAQKRAIEKRTGKKLSDKQYNKLVEMAEKMIAEQKENFKQTLLKEENHE